MLSGLVHYFPDTYQMKTKMLQCAVHTKQSHSDSNIVVYLTFSLKKRSRLPGGHKEKRFSQNI